MEHEIRDSAALVVALRSSGAHASGKPVPYKVAPRRAGDIAACYADPAQALALLGWRAERGLQAMCADAWRWQSGNPDGYGDSLECRRQLNTSCNACFLCS